MVQVCSESVECKVSAGRMWHGLFKDGHNCLPKALPLHVLAVEYPHAQLGFHLPGHERLIELRKALCEEVHEGEENVKKEEAMVKGEAEKAGEEVHKEEEVVKEKVGGAEEAAKKKAAEVGKEAHTLKEKVEEEAEEEVGSAAHEVEKLEKEVGGKVGKAVGGVAHEVKKAVHKGGEAGEAALHKVGGAVHEVEKAVHKEGEAGEAALHKVEAAVGGALDKVGALLHSEELWIHEKIEEVDHESFKIGLSVLAGGLVGTLFKHCKHTFELHDTIAHGSIFHWTSLFETLHPHHSSSLTLKQHALAPFHSVEAYLLEHDDYAH